MSIVLVGESNPYGGGDEFALYPAPDGCSGHRLCCKILGMKRADYLSVFERCNLVQGVWSIRAAKIRATEIFCASDARLILCGTKVAMAFGLCFHPFETAGNSILMLPHPSGLSRLWNEPRAFEQARKAVRRFCPEIAKLIGVI